MILCLSCLFLTLSLVPFLAVSVYEIVLDLHKLKKMYLKYFSRDGRMLDYVCSYLKIPTIVYL